MSCNGQFFKSLTFPHIYPTAFRFFTRICSGESKLKDMLTMFNSRKTHRTLTVYYILVEEVK